MIKKYTPLAVHGANVIAGLRKNVPLRKIKKEHGIGPNALAEIMKRLAAHGLITRHSNLRFDFHPEVAVPEDLFANRLRGAQRKEAPTAPVPKVRDMKEIAHSLLAEISKLEPLLLLHKNLFIQIEKDALEIVALAEEIQPRVLSKDDHDKWNMFLQFEARARDIAERRKGK